MQNIHEDEHLVVIVVEAGYLIGKGGESGLLVCVSVREEPIGVCIHEIRFIFGWPKEILLHGMVVFRFCRRDVGTRC